MWRERTLERYGNKEGESPSEETESVVSREEPEKGRLSKVFPPKWWQLKKRTKKQQRSSGNSGSSEYRFLSDTRCDSSKKNK